MVAARGRDQELVLFYAVAVFVSFLSGLLAMGRFSRQERRRAHTAINLLGAAIVLFTIGANLRRGYPVAFLVASGAIGGLLFWLFWLWHRIGRPRGIAMAEMEAEASLVE